MSMPVGDSILYYYPKSGLISLKGVLYKPDKCPCLDSERRIEYFIKHRKYWLDVHACETDKDCVKYDYELMETSCLIFPVDYCLGQFARLRRHHLFSSGDIAILFPTDDMFLDETARRFYFTRDYMTPMLLKLQRFARLLIQQKQKRLHLQLLAHLAISRLIPNDDVLTCIAGML